MMFPLSVWSLPLPFFSHGPGPILFYLIEQTNPSLVALSFDMRPLTEDESKAVFQKFANYIVSNVWLFRSTAIFTLRVSKGKNLVHLVERQDEAHCFRLHKGRVYYVSEASMRLGISVARSNLVSLGTCLGKFSKSGKFKLHITSLDYLAQYAKYKVSFEPTPAEMPSYKRSRKGVDQTEWRNAFPVRQSCPQGASGPHHRGHTRASGRCCVQHE